MSLCRESGPSTVLVVDDEFFVRIDTINAVESAGFATIEASTADDGLALLSSRPDVRVLITDIEMPGTMDGLQFARRVRERWPSIHVIIISGRRPVAGDDIPANGIFLNKPLSKTQLSQALRGLIGDGEE
ncbi:response regulator [Ancylobacter mangrovi]|uniref:response regulator n=1 Tax=Ancylobacter mangrovi TaxID=2972472 RepID=UPI0021619011|nr:response regulator [Ancylobacter mangrovi]MCS0502943.1 response regulator [Ancylobacter mangrovi]